MENDARLLLDVNDSCLIFSRSKNRWLRGTIKKIYIDSTSNKEWLVVKYGNSKTKKIQRLCNDLAAVVFDENEEEDHRILLEVGSPCNIFSRSLNQWVHGKVYKIFVDVTTNKEWLIIKYGNNKTKKIQRFCKDLQAIKVDIDETVSNNSTEIMSYNSNMSHHSNMSPHSNMSNISYIDEKTEEYEHEIIPRIPKWKQLKSLDLPSHYFSKIIAINQYEFIIATNIRSHLITSDERAPHGIYKYNVLENSWDLAVDYLESNDLPIISRANLCAFDKTKNELFIGGYTSYKCNVIKYDLNAKRWKYILNNAEFILSYYVANSGGGDDDDDDDDDIMECLFVNDSKIHMIGTFDNTEIRYTVWDTARATFEPIEERVLNDITTNDYYRHPGKSVLIESENRLLAFDEDAVWICYLELIQWTEMRDIRLPFRMGEKDNVCITPDDKYVIFITDKVIILELKSMMFYKSDNIKLPKITGWDASFDCIILPYCNNEEIETVSFRYIKEIANGMKVPMNVRYLIAGYWRKDILYLMEQKSHRPNLWRMDIDDILSSDLYILEKVQRGRTLSLYDDIGNLGNCM